MSERKRWTPPPVTTPEAREDQMIVLAIDLAEQQLREGVASTPVITHYLKLGSEREKLEREKLIAENEALRAKTEQLKSAQRSEETHKELLKAFAKYSGNFDPEEYDDY